MTFCKRFRVNETKNEKTLGVLNMTTPRTTKIGRTWYDARIILILLLKALIIMSHRFRVTTPTTSDRQMRGVEAQMGKTNCFFHCVKNTFNAL